MSVESYLELTNLEMWPVQPLNPDDTVAGQNIHVAGQIIPVAGQSIHVAGDLNSMQVVDNTTNSRRTAYHCIITIEKKFSHTPAFRGRSLFSAHQQSQGSVNNNKFQVEKHSTNS